MTNKWLLGVCGGVGEHFGIDPTWVRVGVIILGLTTICTSTIIIAYGIGWLLMGR